MATHQARAAINRRSSGAARAAPQAPTTPDPTGNAPAGKPAAPRSAAAWRTTVGDPVVYRIGDPGALAAWDAADAAAEEHRQRLDAWLDTLTPPGEERRAAIVNRSAWDGGQTRLVGLPPYLRERPEDYPPGWRKRAADNYLTPYGEKTRNVPAQVREAAAAARAALAAHQFPPDVRRALTAFGMPDRVMEGNRICTYGAARYGDHIYVSWNVAAQMLEEGRNPDGTVLSRARGDRVDLTRWERVPLSQWYALREQHGDTE